MTTDDNDRIPVAQEAGDSAPDADATGESTEPNDLLGELSKAMHAAAESQHVRIGAELQRHRVTQVEAIKARASSESAELKKISQHDVGEIDAWATTATQQIATELARRLDEQRENLQAELLRQEVIVERKVMAVEAAVESHQAELDAFFNQLQLESDPVEIARLASRLPSFPSLTEAANSAVRPAGAETASTGRAVMASAPVPQRPGDAPAEPFPPATSVAPADEPAAVDESPAAAHPVDEATSSDQGTAEAESTAAPGPTWTGDEPNGAFQGADQPSARSDRSDEPATASTSDGDGMEVSPARLMAVTDPDDSTSSSSSGSGGASGDKSGHNGSPGPRPWPMPGASAVHAGANSGNDRTNHSLETEAEEPGEIEASQSDEGEESSDQGSGSLLRSIPSTRPMGRPRLWNRKPDDPNGAR